MVCLCMYVLVAAAVTAWLLVWPTHIACVTLWRGEAAARPITCVPAAVGIACLDGMPRPHSHPCQGGQVH